jgi:ATP-dependent exoDNAse (exonuclease V) beta subunit
MSFTVYKSSAGSGKTFTLVKEYLTLALSDAEQPPHGWRHILAVTFTNKAASEMKTRILETLDQLSKGNTSSVMAGLLKETTGLDADELQKRATRLLQTILHNYGDFAVGTIDSFVHRIVRTFAYDLDLPVNFEIEMDVDKMLREAVDALIERIGSNPQLTEFLVRFAESKAEEDKHWQIEKDLQLQAKYLLSDDGSNPAELLSKLDLSRFAAFRDTLEKEIAAFETAVQHEAKQAADAIQQSGAETSWFNNGSRGFVNWFQKLAAGENIIKDFEPNTTTRQAFELDKRYAGKATQSQKEVIDRIWPRLEEAWNALEALRVTQFGHYVLYVLLLRNIYAIAVLNEIERELITYKNDNNVLHISEFNRRIADIVENEPVPFIYERLGEKYQHYLIDEFQDTSSLQWKNLLPLLDNALSENRFTMVVGDGKQAIYRWRGGEVEQFARLPHVAGEEENELVAERAASLKRNYREMQLMQNFRSKAEIIQFNNLFFRSLSALLTETHQPIYIKLEQEYDPKNTGGLVRIEVINAETKMEKEEHAQRTVAYVEDLLREGFRYNEIAVLTRTNREGALAAQALIGAGIPVLSSESLLLKNAASVNFLTAMLRLIESANDDIARATILRFLVDTNKIPGPLHERITELKSFDSSPMRNLLGKYGFTYNAYVLAKFPLYQRCQELLRLFGMAETPDPYVLYFLDEVLEYSSARNHLPADFLNWWEGRRDKASVSVPEGTDAVRVMTIHKSKGLEFPAVVLPFCNWGLQRGKDQLWIPLDDELLPDLPTALVSTNSSLLHTEYASYYSDERSRALLDNLNLVYVAQTRAVERLYILTGPGNSTSSLNKMNDLYHHFFRDTGFTFTSSPVYESGNPELHVPKNGAVKATIIPEVFGNFNWSEHISIRAGSGSSWAEHEKQNDRQVLLKTLLRRLRTADDTAKMVEQAVQDGLILTSERQVVNNQLMQFVQLPELEPFYNANNTIRTGDEIALPGDTGLKPERVVIFDDHTKLLSFETASEEVPLEEIKMILERIYNRPCTVQVFDPGILSV